MSEGTHQATRSPGRFAMAAGAVAGLALLALPFVAESYLLFQVTIVMIYAIVLLGLNFLMGFGGQISLGHSAFFALGAYVTAILASEFSVPLVATIPAAAVICFLVGVGFGFPALRLEGLHLALATFALAVAVPQLIKYKGLRDWTGGSNGLSIDRLAPPQWLGLDSDQVIYLLTLAVAACLFVFAWNMLRGLIGTALVAVRDHPIAARAMGVDVRRYKTVAFGISALYAGVGGALSAIAIGYVSPDSFGIFLSVTFFVGVVVGGVATISGAIYGALFIHLVPTVAESISKSAAWAAYAVLLIATVYVAPAGIAGAIGSLRSRLQRRRGDAPAQPSGGKQHEHPAG